MSLLRNTFVQTSLTLVSRILGFARDLALSAMLGAGPIADAFYAALRFPNLFRRFFAEGAFAQAFVPVYAKSIAEAQDGEEVGRRLASEALSVLLSATLALTIAAQIAMPWLYLALFVGYRDDPETFALGVLLAQITMPYLAAMTASALFSGVLNARGRFALSAAAPTVLNLALLVAVAPFLLFGDLDSEATRTSAATAAAVAVTVAGLMQAGLLWWGCARQGVRLRLGLPRLTPDMRRLIGLAIPGAIAGSGVQINILVSQALATEEEGAISYLYNADRLYQLPLGLIGVAVGLALLPRLARAAQSGDEGQGRQALDEAVSLSMAFTLPAAAALMVMPYFLMLGFWVRGAFTAEDARATADALFHFGWGVPAFVLIKVFAPAFFAREDTRRPMQYSLIGVAANIALGASLFFALRSFGLQGFVGLAIATSLAAWLNAGLLAATLLREGRYAPSAAAKGRLLRIALATAIMAFLLGLLASQRDTLIALLLNKEIAILAISLFGFLVYALAALAVGAVRPSELRGVFRREAVPPGVRLDGGDG